MDKQPHSPISPTQELSSAFVLSEMRKDMRVIHEDMREIRNEFRNDMISLRADVRNDYNLLNARIDNTNNKIDAVRSSLSTKFDRHFVFIIGSIFLSIIIPAIKSYFNL